MNNAASNAPRRIDGWIVAGDGDFPADPIERLIYYARFAPSSHNTQPWRFLVTPWEFMAKSAEIQVFADHNRWLRVADPERRELHVSIGCAIESICIAADFAGFGTSVGHFPARHDASLVARIRVALAGPKRDQPAADLLDAMAARRTSHRLFEPDRIPGAADIDRLARAAAIFGVELRTLSDPDRLDDLARLEDRADELLFADPAYREELGRGIGDGMLGTSWLLSKLGQFAVGRLGATRPIGAGDVERLSSAPMVGLLVTPGSSPAEAVRVGEAYLRMALLAESAGIRVQPVSQILETTHTRDRLNAVFGVSNAVPQHLFRLGYAAGEPGTRPRRAMRELLVRMQ